MAITYSKRENEKKKEKKKKEKLAKKEKRKQAGSKSFDDMIAYVDENGMLHETPPEVDKKNEIDIDSIEISIPKREAVEIGPKTGIVDHFNEDKGYGFIKDLEDNTSYFFHISNAPTNIAEGNKVTFETERGDKGLNAVSITIEK